MRLIDADELNKKAHICLTKDVAPTVEAVPMSVIEDIKAEMKQVTDMELLEYWHSRDKFLEIIDKHISGKESEDKK